MKILVLNCGSSSLKVSLYQLKNHTAKAEPALWDAALQWKAPFDDVTLEIKSASGKLSQKLKDRSFDAALSRVIGHLVTGKTAVMGDLNEIDAIGHRIVHGGRFYRESVIINADVKEKIKLLAEYAPLHNLGALRGIEEMQKHLPKKSAIAVFDTAFHHTMPPEAITYPLPYKWFEEGIQRYGFHGISHQYCTKRVLELVDGRPQKIVICHLGAGASLCAVKDKKSIDTTMGFTPLEGLMMNTRSGTIDPGIILEKLKTMNLTELTNELYRESGLLGVSGRSSDMRDILKDAPKHPRAHLAFEVYIHRLSSCIGSMIASLSGLDALVFTAGIGENTPVLRQRVSERFAFLGIDLDQKKNDRTFGRDEIISSKKSSIQVAVIHTQEAFEIARECWRLTTKR